MRLTLELPECFLSLSYRLSAAKKGYGEEEENEEVHKLGPPTPVELWEISRAQEGENRKGA